MRLRSIDLIICLAIVGLIAPIYVQVRTHDFIQYDDPIYVTDNPIVQKGLTPAGFVWAFQHGADANYWTPLTFLSHMTDVQFFDNDAGKHHLTSVALHTTNAVMLFLVLMGMTGSRWRSAAVAALWAVHPLHVESVAWIAERKDVLSALFFILSLGAYSRYVRSESKKTCYAILLALFILGLMSKPMVMTLPPVLLLLDYWPMKRSAKWNRLLAEKIPLLALSAACLAVTWIAQRNAHTVGSLQQFPISFRLSNAFVSIGRYLAKTIWPARLAVFYPPPPAWPFSLIVVSLACVFAITAIAFRQAKTRPYLLVGWLWFIGMLAPVIGLLQVGRQAMADRYMYLPHIGLFIAIVWSAGELATRSKAARDCLVAAAALALIALTITSFVQVRHWQNTETIFAHALEVTDNNEVALNQIGNVLARRNQLAEAESCYQNAIRIAPDYALARQNLGNLLVRERRFAEAVPHFRAAVGGGQSDEAKTQLGLGSALSGMKDYEEADKAFANCLQRAPQMAVAHIAWGLSYKERGDTKSAIEQFKTATQLDPKNLAAKRELAALTTTPATTSATTEPSSAVAAPK